MKMKIRIGIRGRSRFGWCDRDCIIYDHDNDNDDDGTAVKAFLR
jgi:hypothetical protein